MDPLDEQVIESTEVVIDAQLVLSQNSPARGIESHSAWVTQILDTDSGPTTPQQAMSLSQQLPNLILGSLRNELIYYCESVF
jgi:hypothetical protein